jgi:dihydrofolate synthase/folylpolyglutamate synthase
MVANLETYFLPRTSDEIAFMNSFRSDRDVSLSSVLSRLNVLIDWERRERKGEFRNLEPIIDLLGRLGNPQRRFRSIHVTGTKGKGSVCALIEAALTIAGISVGKFSSPHVERATERVTFNGSEIQEREFAAVLDESLAMREIAVATGTPGKDATWFDVVTAAAFLAFASEGVEWAVVEVGIGGSLDSTNVIQADVSVVTNIALEHVSILGNTRIAIARDKVGILKRGGTLVTAVPPDDEVFATLAAAAKSLGSEIVLEPYDSALPIRRNNLRLAGAVLDALGKRNLRTHSITASRAAGSVVGGWLISENDIGGQLPGRMERFELPTSSRTEKVFGTRAFSSEVGTGSREENASEQKTRAPFRFNRNGKGSRTSVPVILDGAHVAFNLSAVFNDLTKHQGFIGPCIVVFATGRDKDARDLLLVLSRHAKQVIFTTWSGSAPTYAPEQLQDLATSFGVSSEIQDDPNDALMRAVDLAANDGWVLITGSLHLAGQLCAKLRAEAIRY